MANYTLNNEINEMKRFMTEQLPNWENATADMLLEALSKSDNQQIKETAEYIKASKKSPEMMRLLDFAFFMIRNNPTPIKESIYDTATDGIRELNQHRIDNIVPAKMRKAVQMPPTGSGGYFIEYQERLNLREDT